VFELNSEEISMFLKNFGKALLVSALIHIIALMAVLWAPWPPSLPVISVLEDLKRDRQIGFYIYQMLVGILIVIATIRWKAFSGYYEWREVLYVAALWAIPSWIIAHYGEYKFFSLPWNALQFICTTELVNILLKMKSDREPQPPA
jgi:hypothetical protein